MTDLRAVLAGDRGRLLIGLLFAEFGTAVQTIAESAVLPLASRELDGAALYGATLAAPTLSAIVFILVGPALTARLGARGALVWSTVVYVVGVLLAVLAPAMPVLFLGRLVQGAAIGLLSGFGLTAVGTLYEDAERPRALALFAISWLLPSVLGPVVNSLVAGFAGWRWAMAWPAVVVLAARILIGRRTDLLPRAGSSPAVPVVSGSVVLAGLVLATAASGLPEAVRLPAWMLGLAVTAASGALIVRRLAGRAHRAAIIGVFAGMVIGFFGGEGLLGLAVIDVVGAGVVGASIAYAAGGVTWSLLGLRPATGWLRAAAAPVGALAVAVPLGGLAILVLSGPGPGAIVLVVVAWAVAGCGMGVAYPVLSSRPFDGVDAARVPALSAAVAFANTAGSAVSSLLGGGFYSVTSSALPPVAGIGGGFVLVAAAAVVTLLAALVLLHRERVAP